MTPAPVQCIECTRFSLRGHKGMAAQGYGQCALVAGADVVERRRQWLDDKQQAFFDAIERSKNA